MIDSQMPHMLKGVEAEFYMRAIMIHIKRAFREISIPTFYLPLSETKRLRLNNDGSTTESSKEEKEQRQGSMVVLSDSEKSTQKSLLS